MNRYRNDDAFTLLEVIIAFTILALSLAIATQTIARSVITYTRADLLERASDAALEVAATRLSSVGEPGTGQGVLGNGARWSTVAELIEDVDGSPLLAVTIEVTIPEDLTTPYRFTTFVAP
ncbi:MAG: prepilin-type N-terminal cleavage/methylation domain-containing protein [Pseudomonadota bacterium]